MFSTIMGLGFFAIVLALVITFVPAFIAFKREHHYKWIILILCLFTPVGGVTWIIALVWSVWPANKSLIDPVVGNVTGTGVRNAGDTAGDVAEGVKRGQTEEKSAAK
jgi:hypothetical protein